MAELSVAVAQDVDRIDLAPIILKDAPALGGRERLMNVVAVALHGDLADTYNVHPNTILLMLQTAIGEYRRQAERPDASNLRLSTVYRVLLRIVTYPFRTRRIRNATGIIVAVIGLMASLQQLGWLQTIQGIIFPANLP
jgi:hypothetical protein